MFSARGTQQFIVIIALLVLMVAGCSDSNQSQDTSSETAGEIKYNQVAYLPNRTKLAIIPDPNAQNFSLLDSNNKRVFGGKLSAAEHWAMSDEKVKIADFSEFRTPGNYRLIVGDADTDGADFVGDNTAANITIDNQLYGMVHDMVMRSFYLTRASIEIEAQYAGKFARPLGHGDDQVLVHESAASDKRPAGIAINAPKGWYDAGDFGKYIVNSGISTYTLLAAYQHFADFYQQRTWNIPESSNDMPDMLDEIKWNLDWMESMQDPGDGGVYHKLTTMRFSGELMPHQATQPRFVFQKSTEATLDFAAVMAVASRVYLAFDSDLANRYKINALRAWGWAIAHPAQIFVQPQGVNTGQYTDKNVADEFQWAAAELFLTTGDQSFLQKFLADQSKPTIPDWRSVAMLGYISLAYGDAPTMSDTQRNAIKQTLIEAADDIVAEHKKSAYRVSMRNQDFVWGSNGVVGNRAMIALIAYHFTGDSNYLDAAIGLFDYLFGRNPTGYSYLTGAGFKPVMHIHHRISRADNIDDPVPGLLSGGPQNKFDGDKKSSANPQGCVYPSELPAKAFVDDWCSYSTNEIAINWNAPLVYLLAAMQNLDN